MNVHTHNDKMNLNYNKLTDISALSNLPLSD